MKNLFDYATSELSQDAFLRWLFENYNCENEVVKEAVYTLLRRMTGIDDLGTGTITELKTTPQFKHMDVVVEFTHNEKRHILVIEDKTFSGEHSNQFEIYRKNIEKEYEEPYKNNRAFFVFYKTDIKNPEERNRAVDKNWKTFYLDEIYHFFEEITNTDCLIFEQYKEHLKNLYNITKEYQKVPMKSWKDRNHALLYFRAYISEKLAGYVNCHAALKKPSFAGWHSYSSLWVERENKTIGEKIKFSMEISFHPTWDRATVTVRLSGYNGNEKVHDKFKEWVQDELKKGGLFKSFSGEKWCVAQANDRLEYPDHRELDLITEKCHHLIDEFANGATRS